MGNMMNTQRTPKKGLEWFILRWGTHIGSLIPLLLLVFDYFTENLTANPIQDATQRTGRTAITLLVLMLACTPINILFGTNKVAQLRKPLGLYALLYAGIHFLIFTVIDYGLVFPRIITTFSQKPYLLLGLATFLVLILMGLTSFKWWMRKMGKNWKRLHRLIYPVSILIAFHYALAQKGDVFGLRGNIIKPVIYGIIILIMLGIRLPFIKKGIIRLRSILNMRSINIKSNINSEKSSL
jgi:methionine sulfoxide reductase heme-binding subunit